MKRRSDLLKDYTGPNPFHESQGRAGAEQKILAEFFPTSGFWSLFNDQHEILLGTRGSGKTFLLRMMSYSLLRDFDHPRAKEILRNRSYVAFYVPLHLEFLASIAGKKCNDDEKLEYFQFAFNCAAAKALLAEVHVLLKDCFSATKERLIAEEAIIRLCGSIWFAESGSYPSTIEDLQWEIEKHYSRTPFWRDGTINPTPPLARPILAPITAVLAKVGKLLGLTPGATTWVATIDEAEFLSPSFIRCLNSFMRSEKRPLVVKIATLPFKHSTCETAAPGISIQPHGNDFNYRPVDLSWDSADFEGLTNFLCDSRLRKCGLPSGTDLESFLGTIGNDDLIDYFRAEFSPEETSNEALLKSIVESLSVRRRENYEKIKADPQKVDRPYLHRFAPVYFTRRMRIENARGARTPGWFAGAHTIRRIADGNPRRFIQIMNHLVEQARALELTARNQHRILSAFCQRYFDDVEGYPECGPMLKQILDDVGQLLSARVHGNHMTDSGCNFSIEQRLLDVGVFRKTIEFAIAYSIIIADEDTFFGKLQEASDLRLSYIFAVTFWLPMRKGDPATLRSRHAVLTNQLSESLAGNRQPDAVRNAFQLHLFEGSNDEAVEAS
ncbi:MAG TPA: hypothetical protein VJU77_09880 [Chthoniobacterales bacterium]|nr:hypothetical protein [Chthoniobacterales bacterium]